MVEKAPLLGEVEMKPINQILGSAGLAPLDSILERVDDLEPVKTALIREYAIRTAMLSTGEDRRTIIDMMDAVDSMDQEAVLALTSGAPTTLADGLQAYLETLELGDADIRSSNVIDALHALLVYPWPEEEATIATHGANASVGLRVEHSDRPNDETFSIYVGGQEAYRGSAAREGAVIAEEVADAVHRAVLARVIGDRPHTVRLSHTDRLDLLNWLDRPNGSWVAGGTDRLSAVDHRDGGVSIQTSPYIRVTPPWSRSSVDTLQP
jgi:hypothetical protein